MDAALKDLGTTTSQYAILSALQESPSISGADLARRCFITPQSVNELLAGMEKAGLIDRTPSPTHGRIVDISLSPMGAKRLRMASLVVDEIERMMLRGLSESERRSAAAALGCCIENLAESESAQRTA
jgi:DNA-binding MarR family transcriptional regulator